MKPTPQQLQELLELSRELASARECLLTRRRRHADAIAAIDRDLELLGESRLSPKTPPTAAASPSSSGLLDPDKFYTYRQLSEIIGMHRRTLERLVHMGKLPKPFRLGELRFSGKELNAALSGLRWDGRRPGIPTSISVAATIVTATATKVGDGGSDVTARTLKLLAGRKCRPKRKQQRM
jgi:predicted DNA-binding transcriptional regulator AlpA